MTRRLALFALLAPLALTASWLPAQDASFKVVVHADNPASSLSKAKVSQLFLKKATRWDGGGKVAPVDQAESRPVRRSFCQAVLGKKVAAVKSYWQKMTFSGRATPPPELTSDRDVLSYVRNNSGAIGYVSAGASLGDDVKTLRITQ